MRLRVAGDLCVAVDPHINHESSRKAFETGRRLRHLLSPSIIISITNLAERHLRLPRPQRHMPSRSCPISITNLAERHLRPRTQPRRPQTRLWDINHESSRKAFETGLDLPSLRPLRSPISITNLAERHLRLAAIEKRADDSANEYQSRI